MEKKLADLSDTKDLAVFVTKILEQKKINKKAFVIGLSGNLGAGKTAFVKFFGEILGVMDVISSPTFVIERDYDISFLGFTKMIHFDFYRFEERKELLRVLWDEIIKNEKNLILIEWPEKVLQKDELDILIELDFDGEKHRTAKINL